MRIENNTDRTRNLLMKISQELEEYIYTYNRVMLQLNRMAYWKGIDASIVKGEAMQSMAQLRMMSTKVRDVTNRAIRVNNRYTRIIEDNYARMRRI